MKTSLLDYHLPPELIAERPAKVRRNCRLLRLDRGSGDISHHRFADLPSLLLKNDLLVANDTAVIPARLIGTRHPGGGEAEVFLLERLDPRRWHALVRPGRRLREGAIVTFGNNSAFSAVIESIESDGARTVRFHGQGRFNDWLKRHGAMPLPPYIRRPATKADAHDYQTIFAAHAGAVASPTAGLHFDPPLVTKLRKSGIQIATLTLHVGAGTFRPIRSEHIEDHNLDAEPYSVGAQTIRRILARRYTGKGRVIAIGTTVTRTLETLFSSGDPAIQAHQGRSDLLITPGHTFRAIDGLITNFHLPRSSLIALVAAFAGLDPVLRAYRLAIESRYRFYSYGDAMLIL